MQDTGGGWLLRRLKNIPGEELWQWSSEMLHDDDEIRSGLGACLL